MIDRLLSAALVVMFASSALAHGDAQWIADLKLRDPISDLLCCGPRDCKKMAPNTIKETQDGYFLIQTGEVIPHERVILGTPDGSNWRCAFQDDTQSFTNGEEIFAKGTTRCLILSGPGV